MFVGFCYGDTLEEAHSICEKPHRKKFTAVGLQEPEPKFS